jgi:hypothetical protein
MIKGVFGARRIPNKLLKYTSGAHRGYFFVMLFRHKTSLALALLYLYKQIQNYVTQKFRFNHFFRSDCNFIWLGL